MADKITESHNTNPAIRKPDENEGLILENDIEKALLHPFFVSAINNIYSTENEDWELTDNTETSVNFNEKQGD
ncbi:hypothetical protein [Chryseobacterium indologenes]|uniref:hypothetical protein n=1 Tax=Chryseobacterium indologenes TaxID=253 RepID=UPI003016E55F